jgi:hypothetical protein
MVAHPPVPERTVTAAPAEVPAAWRDDVASVDALIHAMYALMSGPPGNRDWNRLRHLYLPGARMIPTGKRPNGEDGLRVMDPEQYIASVQPYFHAHGFFETEIARREERFGPIVHAFSTYESRHRADDPAPFVRGINSIQLLQRDGRWWVVSVFWDNESAANPIPPRYLENVSSV